MIIGATITIIFPLVLSVIISFTDLKINTANVGFVGLDNYKWVFNEQTCDTVLQDLMENGIKVEGGERIGRDVTGEPLADFWNNIGAEGMALAWRQLVLDVRTLAVDCGRWR